MKKYAIIYSPGNLDSTLAAAMDRHISKNVTNIGTFDPAYEVTTFPYVRALTYNELPKDFDHIAILGADISPTDLPKILEANPISQISYHCYDTSTVYDSKMLRQMEERGVRYSRFEIRSIDAGENEDPSVALKVFRLATEDERIMLGTKARDLIRTTTRYGNFLTLPDKKEDEKNGNPTPMNLRIQEETIFFFANKRMIYNAARGDTEWNVVDVGTIPEKGSDQKPNPAAEQVWKDYVEYDKQMRRLVEANNRMCYYAGANGSAFHTATCAVTEQDFLHVMRFINYGRDEVISFEDTRDCRVYRILAKRGSNLEWYIKRFQPSDVWTEGSLVCLKTSLPVHMH